MAFSPPPRTQPSRRAQTFAPKKNPRFGFRQLSDINSNQFGSGSGVGQRARTAEPRWPLLETTNWSLSKYSAICGVMQFVRAALAFRGADHLSSSGIGELSKLAFLPQITSAEIFQTSPPVLTRVPLEDNTSPQKQRGGGDGGGGRWCLALMFQNVCGTFDGKQPA